MANHSASPRHVLARIAVASLIAAPAAAIAATDTPELIEPPALEIPAQAPRLYLSEAKVYPRSLQSVFHRTSEERLLRDRLRPSSRVTRHNLMNSRFADYLSGMFKKSGD